MNYKPIIGYPGGKSKAARLICSFFPQKTDLLISPFFGAGHVEFWATRLGIHVFGSDLFEPLVNFWNHALNAPASLATAVNAFMEQPITRRRFFTLKNSYEIFKPLDAAAVFYILNQCSFGCFTLSGTFSRYNAQAFHTSDTGRIRSFGNHMVTVANKDYKSALTFPESETSLFYCDPPYDIERKIYGKQGSMHRGFSHSEFARQIQTKEKWIVSYNDTPKIRAIFRGYKMLKPRWKYSIRADVDGADKSNELLILSDYVWARHEAETLLGYFHVE